MPSGAYNWRLHLGHGLSHARALDVEGVGLTLANPPGVPKVFSAVHGIHWVANRPVLPICMLNTWIKSGV